MLFFLIDVLLASPARFFELLPVAFSILVLPLIVGLTVHEFAHAAAAHLLGDDTAARAGRLSLNPMKHLDPMGTILLVVAGFGWGKPVPVNPSMLPNARRGMAIVAAAGPLSNLALAALLTVPVHLGVLTFHAPFDGFPRSVGSPDMLPAIIGFGMYFNLLLGVFNLLPIAPLDGSKVLMGIAPRRLAFSLARVEPYGMLVLLGIFAADWVLDAGIMYRLTSVPAGFLGSLFVGQPFL